MLEKILAGLITLIPGLSFLKKKPYCLWYLDEKNKWINSNPNGNSARRCNIAKKALVIAGFKESELIILAKGITPPNKE